MDLFDFTEDEKLALLELLILGMYSDAHLALKEDEKVQVVLDTFGFATKKERYECVDAAVTRVRQHVDRFEDARDYAMDLIGRFSSAERRKQAYEALEEMFRSCPKVNEDQKKFLAALQRVFQA
jgi:hypothetical protein